MDAAWRLFAALPLGAEIRESLVATQRELARHWPPGAVRWARPDQLHLTLRFYGNVAAVEVPTLIEALQGACRGPGALALELAGLDGFPNPNQARVLWAAVRGDVAGLARLEERIAAASDGFGDHHERREFHPHLTLGRIVERGLRAAPQGQKPWWEIGGPTFGSWSAAAVHLIRSQLAPGSAHYTELASLPLDEPPAPSPERCPRT